MNKINEMLATINIWTPGAHFRGERHERLAHVFWDAVMGWDKPPVNQQEARTRQARIVNFLTQCEHDDRLDRLVFKKQYYYRNKERIFRFFTQIQKRLSTYRKNGIERYYWVVVDENGIKGFFWGDEVPQGNHIIFGKKRETPQPSDTPQPTTPEPDKDDKDEDEVPY